MTYEQFNTQVQRLASVYGARHYPEERVSIFWDMVGEGDIHMFSKAVRGWIRDNTQPALGKFFEDFHVQTLRNSYAVAVHREIQCIQCLDTGMVLGNEKCSGDDFVFLCSECNYAETHRITGEIRDCKKRVAKWQDAHSKLFTLFNPTQEQQLTEAGHRFLTKHGFHSIQKRLTDILLEEMPKVPRTQMTAKQFAQAKNEKVNDFLKDSKCQ
jgi:hypothetical protein